MKTIVIKGWKPGFDKVLMNKLLQDEFSYSLHDAKKAVDKILSREHLVLSASHDVCVRAVSELERLRVEYELLE